MQIAVCGGVGEGVRRGFQMGNGDSLRGDLGGWWLCSWIEIITCEISEDEIREIKQVSPQVLGLSYIMQVGRKGQLEEPYRILMRSLSLLDQEQFMGGRREHRWVSSEATEIIQVRA